MRFFGDALWRVDARGPAANGKASTGATYVEGPKTPDELWIDVATPFS
jgi:hypothetical protein